MKIKEQLEQSQTLSARYYVALCAMVAGTVAWTEPRTVATVPGMTPKHITLGLIDNGMHGGLVIIHRIDEQSVSVLTPNQVAEWPWPVVDKFPGLAEFLRRHVDISAPLAVTVHTPGYAWVRTEGKQV